MNTRCSEINYDEGLKVGHKGFDAQGLTPLLPFGYGLSYTRFAFARPQLAPDAPVTDGFRVSFDLTNTGTRAGAEVAQVYLGLPSTTGESPRRLVGWQRVLLQPEQRQSVTVTVDARDASHPLSYWDTASNGWRIAPGQYSVYLGNSSRNLTLVGTFQVEPSASPGKE